MHHYYLILLFLIAIGSFVHSFLYDYTPCTHILGEVVIRKYPGENVAMRWPFHTQQKIIYIRGIHKDSMSSLLVEYLWQTAKIAEAYRNRLHVFCTGETNVCITLLLLTMEDAGTYVCTTANDQVHSSKFVVVIWGRSK